VDELEQIFLELAFGGGRYVLTSSRARSVLMSLSCGVTGASLLFLPSNFEQSLNFSSLSGKSAFRSDP
jgi:hypothetical protein